MLITTKLSFLLLSIKDSINQFIKGAYQLAYKYKLIRDQIITLKKALDKVIKRKLRKRKRVQDSRTLIYNSRLKLAPINNSTIGKSTKRSSSKVRANSVQLT